MTVFAAGALCWREVDGQLLIAIIHRKRYGDWSWPKGKVDAGESLPQAAVREIREETGYKVKLGVHLGKQNYMLQNGAAKEVHYWAAKVTEKALAKSTFKPDEEVEKVEWKTPAELELLLSYEQDKEFLTKIVDLHKQGLLMTRPFVLLRHAKATPRGQWPKDEAHRPLLPLGQEQAKAIVPILAAYGIEKSGEQPVGSLRQHSFALCPFQRAQTHRARPTHRVRQRKRATAHGQNCRKTSGHGFSRCAL